MEVGKETSHKIKRGERKKELIEEVSKFYTHYTVSLKRKLRRGEYKNNAYTMFLLGLPS